METSFAQPDTYNKEEKYKHFLDDYRNLIEGETNIISTLANTAAALKEAFGFFWVGFYLVSDEQWLSLGPFQGSVACTRIRRGRGVCGTAWATASTQLVPDVDAFPGHIACSSLSRSEVVVPLLDSTGTVRGVLDIDSDELAAFDTVDQSGLEDIVRVLCEQLF